MRSILESIKGTINNWWIFLSSGILFIITGIIVFRYPAESYFSLSIVFGVLLFAVGIIRTVTAIVSRFTTRDWGWNLAFGIIEVIMGFILMIHPGITEVTLPFFFGFWLLLMGAYLIAFSFQFKDYNVPGWGWPMLGAVLTVILSILVIFNPGAGAFTLILFTGISLIVVGLFYLILAYRLRAIKKDFDRNLTH